MDEEFHGGSKIAQCPRVRNVCKKDFVENWLVNVTNCYETSHEGNREQSNQDSLDSETERTTQSDLWGLPQTSYRTKKKASKLQFLSTLKNIFKKKKDSYGNDTLTETSFSIPTMDRCRKPTTVREPNDRDSVWKAREPNDRDSVWKAREPNDRDSVWKAKTDLKRDGETQTALMQDNILRVQELAVHSSTNKTLDPLSRGFSEIFQYKGYTSHDDTSESSSLSDNLDTSQMTPNYPESDTGVDGTMNPAVDKMFNTKTQHQNSGDHSQQINLPFVSKPVNDMNHVDSYMEKVELIKKYFENSSAKKQEVPKSKASIHVLRVPVRRQRSSKATDDTTLSALTKDLTEVPYLREHERILLQGKNKELCFRINALFAKFSKKNPIVRPVIVPNPSCTVDQRIASTSQHRGLNKLKKKRSHSNSECVRKCRSKNGLKTPGNVNKLYSIASRDLSWHTKIEQLFVKDRINSDMVSSCNRPKNERNHISVLPEKTRAWYDAIEQVRAGMMKINEEMVDALKNSRIRKLKEFRCQSKISVALSSSDWEDVSTPSTDTTCSNFRSNAIKPLPNIPCTPSFRNHFRQNF